MVNKISRSGLAWAALLAIPAVAVLVIDQAFSLLFAQYLPVARDAGTLGPFGLYRLDHAVNPFFYGFPMLVQVSLLYLCRLSFGRAVRVALTLAVAFSVGAATSFVTSLVHSGVVHDFLTIRLTDPGILSWIARLGSNGNGHETMVLAPADFATWLTYGLVLTAVVVIGIEFLVGLVERGLRAIFGRHRRDRIDPTAPARNVKGRHLMRVTLIASVALVGLVLGMATAPGDQVSAERPSQISLEITIISAVTPPALVVTPAPVR